jgi:hypothetical protein
MKTFTVKTRFIFTGTFFVKAGSKAAAKRLVEESCGMVSGGTIHASLPVEDADWEFPVHPEKETGRITLRRRR